MERQANDLVYEMRSQEQFLLNWLRRFVGDWETAVDLKQSVFVLVLEYSRENHIDNPKALMFKIARNLAVNEMRRRKRHNQTFVCSGGFENSTPDEELVPSHAPTPEETTASRQNLRRLANAINLLPERQKQTVMLSRLKGYTYKQIAKEFGVSQSSVEKYMINALKTLRAELEDE